MLKVKVCELNGILGGELISKDADAPVKGLSIDTRTIRPGDFYFAVRGDNFDGHDFIPDAVSKGAAGIIAERKCASGGGIVPGHFISVRDSREAMRITAKYLRSLVDIPVIGITGTNGKTTVKEMVGRILSSRSKICKSRKSFNNSIGVALTCFELDSDDNAAVFELGSNHPGEISALADIIAPSIAVITNVGDGHLEFFGDRKGVFIEKTSIARHVPGDGYVFLNKDDPFLSGTDCGKAKVRYFGSSGDCDYRVGDIVYNDNGYDAIINDEKYRIPVPGVHNVMNAAAAIGVAETLGMCTDDIKKALAGFSLPEKRLEKHRVRGLCFINDAYNANPDSFRSALDVLKGTHCDGNRILVAGDMLELGDATFRLHQEAGRDVASKNIDYLITLGKAAESIARGAVGAGMKEERVFMRKSHEEVAATICSLFSEKDIVLLKGSRGAKLEEVIKCFTTYCSR